MAKIRVCVSVSESESDTDCVCRKSNAGGKGGSRLREVNETAFNIAIASAGWSFGDEIQPTTTIMKDNEIILVTHKDEVKKLKVDTIRKIKVVSKYGMFFKAF